jgi:hypothetical protein
MEAKLVRLLFQLFTVTLAGIGAVILAPNYRAQAATTYEELADTYIMNLA